jgi:hypothetical protein
MALKVVLFESKLNVYLVLKISISSKSDHTIKDYGLFHPSGEP